MPRGAKPRIMKPGARFGRLVVLRQVGLHSVCQCDCGSDPVIKRSLHLRQGGINSCGCLRRYAQILLYGNPIVPGEGPLARKQRLHRERSAEYRRRNRNTIRAYAKRHGRRETQDMTRRYVLRSLCRTMTDSEHIPDEVVALMRKRLMAIRMLRNIKTKETQYGNVDKDRAGG